MKTKDVIKMLQEADPSGEIECVVGNVDIYSAHMEPAYWDGSMQLLVRDPDCEFYNVIGAIYTSKGSKVSITTMSISDAMLEDPDLPVEVIDTFVTPHLQERVDKWRSENMKIHENVDKWNERRREADRRREKADKEG